MGGRGKNMWFQSACLLGKKVLFFKIISFHSPRSPEILLFKPVTASIAVLPIKIIISGLIIDICSFKNICLSYGERQILSNINLDIYPGEILGLLGPNGVGKSMRIMVWCTVYGRSIPSVPCSKSILKPPSNFSSNIKAFIKVW